MTNTYLPNETVVAEMKDAKQLAQDPNAPTYKDGKEAIAAALSAPNGVIQLKLEAVNAEKQPLFISQVQQAFQLGYEAEFGPTQEQILPIEDVLESFGAEGAHAYFALENGEIVGGTIISPLDTPGSMSLDFLYVNPGTQGKGVGQRIWAELEKLHADVRLWETHTPYFDRRNIHFYVNRLGFSMVEFFNEHHPDPHHPGEPVGGMPDEVGQLMFRFEKEMF